MSEVGKKVIVCVTGGISAYKACDLIIGLKARGCDVRVIMTENAKQFITTMTLAVLSKHPVMHDMWAERQGTVDHIDVARWADAFVVYPASYDIIGKFANGLADDLLSTVFPALPKHTPKIIFPAMNNFMYHSPALAKNIAFLEENYFELTVTQTRIGNLACGDQADGCLLHPRDAVNIILSKMGLKP
jgi:phosphopantothenoylcysteine decarboxylase